MTFLKTFVSASCLSLAAFTLVWAENPPIEPPKPKRELPMDIQQKPSLFNPEQRAELLLVIEEYVKNNPQIIKASLEKLIAAEALEQERKEKEMAASLIKANEAAIFKNPAIPILGNASANRTLAVFVDPYCGYCQECLKDLKRLVQEDSQIKVMVHDVAILGQPSELAVKALLAARIFGKEEELRDRLKQSKTPLDPSGIKTLAKALGVDGDTFLNAMKQEQVTVAYEANMKLVNALKLDAAPTLIHGQEMIQGYLPLDVLQQKLGITVRIQEPSQDGENLLGSNGVAP